MLATAIVNLRIELMADSPKLDLSFLARDVRNQIAHSRDLIEQIKSLRETLPKIEDAETRQKVEQTIKGLLGIVDNINANTEFTTTSGTTTITSSTASFPGTFFTRKPDDK